MENLQLKFLTNKQTIRWLSILDILERSRTCSAKEMSEHTHISTRTLIKEIKNIREFFNDTIELTTSNTGYTFKELNYSKYNALKRQLVSEDPLFIVINSILIGELRTVEDWAFQFHLSESTMKRHVLSVVTILDEYGLEISLTPLDLIGPEVNIRKFFKDFYYEVDLTPHTLLPFEEIQEMVFLLEKELQTALETNISPADFRYFTYIMIQRSRSGNPMPEIDASFLYTEKEREFLSSIKMKIFMNYTYEVSDNELNILYIYMMAQRKITEPVSESEYCHKFKIKLDTSMLLRKFLENYDEQLYAQTITTEALVFLESFIVSITWLHKIGEIMNKTSSNVIKFCKKRFSNEYTYTLLFLEKNHREIGIGQTYLKDIAVNLVLTVEAIRDTYVRNPRKIAFVLEGSFYIRRMVEAKAFRYLRGYHQIFFPTIEELTREYFEINEIDLFVTNQEEYITELVKDIDFVVFKAIPDSIDWNHFLSRINPKITKDFSIGKTVSIKR